MAHAIDRQAINEGVFDGQGVVSETIILPQSPYYAEVDRAISKYAYDPRRTEQLMREAGLSKDTDGIYARGGERFRPDYWVTAGTQSERAAAIISETWRRAGIDNQLFVLSLAAGRDNETRATFPGLTQIGGGSRESVVENFISSQIGSPATRWRGNNRGGWINSEVDLLWESFNTTLDRGERNRQMVEIARILSEQVPAFTYYPNIRVRAFSSALSGPSVGATGSLSQWNIHEWELR
jgi:peptide/nickel transport system substrate-binding protein